MSDILQQHLDSVNERNQKNNLSELLKSKDINSMDLDSLSSIINDSTDLDLSKDEDKKLAIKFLQEIAKKTENQKKIEETDISSIWIERNAFTKILDLVKAFENKKEMESKIFWFTWEELDLLNNFIGEKKLIVKQTQDKINTTKDNVEKTVAVKNESKEERKEIKYETDNKRATLDYLWLNDSDIEDINLDSALKIMSKWEMPTDKLGWESLWYESDWFFWDEELSQLNKLAAKINVSKLKKLDQLSNNWISAKDIVNTKKSLENTKSDEVFNVLCDLNSDWNLNEEDNKSLISWIDILNFIETNNKYENQIIKNIGDILGININSKLDLYNALKNKPSLKYDFFDKLYMLSMTWINLSKALIDWKKWIKSSVDNVSKTLSISEKIGEALSSGFEQKYEESLIKLKASLANVENDEERNKINELINIYSNNKKSFLESFKFDWASVFISLLDNKKWAWAWTTLSNEKVDDFLKNNTSSIIEWMQLNMWLANIWGSYMPWIGINFSSKEFAISEELKASWNAGLFLTVPYLTWTLNYTYNLDDIKNSSLRDFSSAKKLGITWNISTVANWLTLHWTKDQKEAINIKEQQFLSVIDGLFANNFDVSSIKNLKIEDREYLENLSSKIKYSLNLIWFDKLSSTHKKFVLEWIKYSLLNKWREWVYSKLDKDGLDFTWIGLGVQFIAWFLPVPTLWLQVSDYDLKYEKDNHAESLQKISSNNFTSQSEKISWKELISDISEFKNEELDNYLKSNISKFDGTMNWYSTLAMRNPKDYPKFANALFEWNNDKGFSVLERILATDPILKKDKNIQNLLSKFKKVNPEQKAYILAQFEDVIFKDKNSISQVISDKDLWKWREKWLKSVYTNSEIYNEIVDLRNKAKEKIWTNQKKENVSDIMWFVASYKIWYDKDWKAYRLASGEAAIPAGLATAVWWKEWVISITDNEKLVNHTIDKMKNTLYYNQLKSSLEKVIDSKLDNNSFDTLLKKWSLDVNWNIIKLDRDFVFMLYWQCANETLWIRIKSIDLGNGTSTELSFSPNWEIIPNKAILDIDKYNLWIWLKWKEKDSWNNNWWKPEMWTTPGEEKWSQITSTPTEITSPWQTTTSSWTWFNPNN